MRWCFRSGILAGIVSASVLIIFLWSAPLKVDRTSLQMVAPPRGWATESNLNGCLLWFTRGLAGVGLFVVYVLATARESQCNSGDDVVAKSTSDSQVPVALPFLGDLAQSKHKDKITLHGLPPRQQPTVNAMWEKVHKRLAEEADPFGVSLLCRV
jgi:hypothetical protein